MAEDLPAFDPSQPSENLSDLPAFDPSKASEDYSPSPSFVAQAIDVAKQLPTGVVAGLEGIAAAPAVLSGLAGKAVDYLAPTDKEAVGEQEKLKKLIAENRKGGIAQYLPEPETTAGKYARTVGEFAPAALPGTGSIVKRAIMQAALPGVASEAAGQATEGTAIEPWARAGAALVTPSVVSRAISPFNTPSGRAAMTQALEQEGVNAMTAGQRTGNKALQYFESTLGDFPGAGGKATAAQETANRQFTEAVLHRIGLPQGVAPTREALDRQVTHLENNFEQLAANNTVVFDRQFAQDLATTLHRYQRKLPSQQREIIDNVINDLIPFQGQMPGNVYQPLRSDLSRMAHSTQDSEYAAALRGLRNALDGAMARSMRPKDAAAWALNREHWANWKTIQNAAKETDAAGNILITPAKLKEAASAKNRGAFARGEGDFAALAQAGAPLLKQLPQSGTQPRTVAGLIPAILGGAVGLHGGAGVEGALGLAGSGIAAPALAGRTIMSPLAQQYFANRVLQDSRDPLSAAAYRSLLGATDYKNGGSTMPYRYDTGGTLPGQQPQQQPTQSQQPAQQAPASTQTSTAAPAAPTWAPNPAFPIGKGGSASMAGPATDYPLDPNLYTNPYSGDLGDPNAGLTSMGTPASYAAGMQLLTSPNAMGWQNYNWNVPGVSSLNDFLTQFPSLAPLFEPGFVPPTPAGGSAAAPAAAAPAAAATPAAAAAAAPATAGVTNNFPVGLGGIPSLAGAATDYPLDPNVYVNPYSGDLGDPNAGLTSLGTPASYAAAMQYLTSPNAKGWQNYNWNVPGVSSLQDFLTQFPTLAPLYMPGFKMPTAAPTSLFGGMARGGTVNKKVSKESVDYGEGMPARHCGVCRFFHGSHGEAGKCDKVTGIVHSDQWCRLFRKR